MGNVLTQKELRKDRRKFAYWFLGNKCARCSKEGKLDFDHIEPTSKQWEVSALMSSAILVLMGELAKCQLLCRECHIAKTKEDNGQPPEPLHGTITRATHYRCACAECTAVKSEVQRAWRRRSGRSSIGSGPRKRAACGTRRKYHNGCRCTKCRTAQRDYMREYKIRKRGLVAE